MGKHVAALLLIFGFTGDASPTDPRSCSQSLVAREAEYYAPASTGLPGVNIAHLKVGDVIAVDAVFLNHVPSVLPVESGYENGSYVVLKKNFLLGGKIRFVFRGIEWGESNGPAGHTQGTSEWHPRFADIRTFVIAPEEVPDSPQVHVRGHLRFRGSQEPMPFSGDSLKGNQLVVSQSGSYFISAESFGGTVFFTDFYFSDDGDARVGRVAKGEYRPGQVPSWVKEVLPNSVPYRLGLACSTRSRPTDWEPALSDLNVLKRAVLQHENRLADGHGGRIPLKPYYYIEGFTPYN